jgi:hypothetical protein
MTKLIRCDDIFVQVLLLIIFALLITAKSSLFVGQTFLWSIHEYNFRRNITFSVVRFICISLFCILLSCTNIQSTYKKSMKIHAHETKLIHRILHKTNRRNVKIWWCNVQVCLNTNQKQNLKELFVVIVDSRYASVKLCFYIIIIQFCKYGHCLCDV